MSGGPQYVKDFKFPSSFGFTGSATDIPGVNGVPRIPRQRFAEGGKVEKPKAPPPPKPKETKPKEEKLSTLDIMKGKGRKLQEEKLGLKKGGRAKKAMGGKCYAKGGVVKGDDGGNATTQRSKPTSQLDAVAGGKTPLRPGFKKGGRMKGKC